MAAHGNSLQALPTADLYKSKRLFSPEIAETRNSKEVNQVEVAKKGEADELNKYVDEVRKSLGYQRGKPDGENPALITEARMDSYFKW